MTRVSIVATVVATLSGFGLGALWYGPLFGRQWMSLVGLTPVTIAAGFHPIKAYGLTFVLSLVSAYLFGWALGADPALADGLGCGLVVGGGWVAASLMTNDLFERRPAVLMAINGGYHLVRFVLTGLVFAWLG